MLSSTTLGELPTPGIEAALASRILYLFNRLRVLFHYLNEIGGGGEGGSALGTPFTFFQKKKKKNYLEEDSQGTSVVYAWGYSHMSL